MLVLLGKFAVQAVELVEAGFRCASEAACIELPFAFPLLELLYQELG
jgi:hypothetical protein